MRGRTWFFIGMAAGLAVIPFSCRQERYGCGSRSLIPVVVLARDVPAGAVVTYDDLSQRSVPEHLVTSSIVKPDSASHLINQPLKHALQAGDWVRWSDTGEQRPMLQGTTERMVTLDLEAARALNGQLSTLDHVDVLATLVDPSTNQRVAKTLIQNAVVLGVTSRPSPALTSVQLRVTSQDAEKLLLAQELGKLSLSLRAPDDAEKVDRPVPTSVGTLLPPPDMTIRCRHRVLEVIRPDPHWGG
jgi:pilus assembly protein CpaB